MKRFLILLVFASIFYGRENPFLPSDINETDMVASNVIESAPPFETKIIKFPSDARELSHAVFYYKSIDGNIKQKIIDINGSFDWHDEFVLRNQANPNKSATKILDVSVTSKPDIKKENVNIGLNTTKAPKIEPPLKNVNFSKLVKFDIYNSKINIFTKDEKIRDFIIDQPNKIVIDFKKPKTRLNTKTLKVDVGAVKKITFGSHEEFYRVVIWLDGNYYYGIRQSDGGYTLILK
ncbi:AMIN domain-containing protein [Campylobacter hyointestinalis]|uniref:AMIN domain-containing protein n=1 Tax=Campylobacter hyointestinalis TaxID=198 RepID=A0A562X7J0_CAMHY|nr:AMIN domain-containing protein [Campylobacter hyointestinalis]TWO18164.1 AMIN domain-containing protein [Campylobacter hyointestinalis]